MKLIFFKNKNPNFKPPNSIWIYRPQGFCLTEEYKYQNPDTLQRPIQLLEEAVKYDPRLGSKYYLRLNQALYKTQQHTRAEKIVKVCKKNVAQNNL